MLKYKIDNSGKHVCVTEAGQLRENKPFDLGFSEIPSRSLVAIIAFVTAIEDFIGAFQGLVGVPQEPRLAMKGLRAKS